MDSESEHDTASVTVDVPAEVEKGADIQQETDTTTAANTTTANTTTKKKGPPKKPRQSNADSKEKDADRVPGTTALPVSRVKKILSADPELQNTTREALFLMSVATEQFIKRMTDSAYLKARLDARKIITLKDLNIVPETVPLSLALASRKKIAQESKTSVTHADNQPLYALVPQVPMLSSRNPDYPDALIRRLKEPKGAKGRKSAAGAGGEGDGDMTIDGSAVADADEDGTTSAVVAPVGKKGGKGGKAKARKSGADVAADAGMDGAADSTRSEPAGHGKILHALPRPKPAKKNTTKAVDLPTPTVGKNAVDGGVVNVDAMDES
ncbi:hypothetical protein QFC21_005607 [Naganishia friedmannii]|uniref:Uncharacterized protein n=1 Tax=Naganishia friedmannii TaxID=89922 RepID=A0ACC2V848_9TREE|nr:hypothetical protein QFC21_005607 [Naganishia friedmannii]